AYSTVATAASHVGTYAIVPTAVDSSPSKLSNYDVTLVNGTLIVTKAPLTITADNKTKVYGAALPALTVTYSGLVNGDTPATFSSAPNTAPALSTTATAA